ncbi:Uncharacterized membrane protein [Sporobacter termitidis DSM 10068]|uniref:Uncharacterized membrane protein n=1 Tax=Sporobacter termitidis DSM 10068 TaxID=1123282 RepID=A0A1M5XI10_9FIRM|nr:putative ABC transporter permease [Sporobacter termitidis]SHH99450.1 Uncharacterized membrane protein [Sporobacter termitidis DSM 10068]
MTVKYFLWFIAYSFLGWFYESAVCSLHDRRLVNRGFLNGPLCPVYGFGALASILVLDHRTDNVLVLYLAGMLLTCTVEYITAVLLERLFNAKWWDYSKYRFNLKGRVSLLGAVVFGALSVLLIKYIHPLAGGLIDRLPDWLQLALAIGLFVLVLADLYVTVRHLVKLNDRLKEIQAAINGFLEPHTRWAGELRDALLSRFEESDFYNDRIKALFSLSRIQNMRLVKAFPNLRSLKYNDALQRLKTMLVGKGSPRQPSAETGCEEEVNISKTG